MNILVMILRRLQQIVINVIDDAVNQSTSGKIQNGSVNNTINSIKNVVEQ